MRYIEHLLASSIVYMIYEYGARKSMGFMPYAPYMLDVLSLTSLIMQHFDH